MSMNLGTLSSLVDGYESSAAKAAQMRQQAEQQKALFARGLAEIAAQHKAQQQPAQQPAQQIAPLTPGQPASTAPSGGLPPGLAGLAGGGAPQGSPGQPPAIPTGPVPQGASFAQAFSPQAPDPDVSSTAQPDAAGMDDPVKAGEQTIGAIVKGVMAGNPNLDPKTLALAVDQQIETLKGVTPLTKLAMQTQMQTLKLQIESQDKAARQQHAHDMFMVAWRNADTKEKQQAALEEYQQELAGVGGIDDRRMATQVQTTGMRDDTQVQTTGMRDDTQIKTTGMRDDTSRANNADTNARQDRGTAQRQDAQHQQNYRSVYAAYLRAHPKDQAGAVRAAREASGGGSAPSAGGGQPKPSASDIQYLKKHPEQLKAFRAHFGDEAARAAMR